MNQDVYTMIQPSLIIKCPNYYLQLVQTHGPKRSKLTEQNVPNSRTKTFQTHGYKTSQVLFKKRPRSAQVVVKKNVSTYKILHKNSRKVAENWKSCSKGRFIVTSCRNSKAAVNGERCSTAT